MQIITRRRDAFNPICELQLKDHQPNIAEGQFATGKVEFLRRAEPLIIERCCQVPLRHKSTAPKSQGVRIMEPQHLGIGDPKPGLLPGRYHFRQGQTDSKAAPPRADIPNLLARLQQQIRSDMSRLRLLRLVGPVQWGREIGAGVMAVRIEELIERRARRILMLHHASPRYVSRVVMLDPAAKRQNGLQP